MLPANSLGLASWRYLLAIKSTAVIHGWFPGFVGNYLRFVI